MLKYMQTFCNDLKAKIDPASYIFLLLLVGADFTFVVIHFLYKFTHNMECSLFCLTTDRGYAEIFQYIKYFWIVILLIYILRKTKNTSYISWILVFAFFFCDDAFQLHTKIGYYLIRNSQINPPFHLRLLDIGEFVYFIISGAVLMGLLVWAYIRGGQIFKKISIDVLMLVLVIVFFGVFLDNFHVAFRLNGVGLSIIEDTGEMIVSSLILWYVYVLSVNKGVFHLNLPIMFRKLFSRNNP